MTRKLLRFLNGTLTWLEVLVLIMVGAYAGFALWDNQQIYNAADDAVAEMRQLRAEMDLQKQVPLMDQLLAEYEAQQAVRESSVNNEGSGIITGAGNGPAQAENESKPGTTGTGDISTGGQTVNTTGNGTVSANNAGDSESTTGYGSAEKTENSSGAEAENRNKETRAATPKEKTPFEKLQEINPDITAWITVPGTAIDYPVLQGSSNYSYINTDVHGNFALAGSIFLDSRNAKDYTDKYSLLYGHNMDQHRMFSDINLFKEEEFFREHRMGMMLLEDGAHLIESLSAIVVPASDSGLFNPENWTDYSGEEILQKVQENTLYINERGLQTLQEKVADGEEPRIICLSTCSDEFTDARTIVLTLLDP